MVARIYNPRYMGSISGKVAVQTNPGINARPYAKNKAKRAGGVAKVACLVCTKL
jgi:hypothetical protein